MPPSLTNSKSKQRILLDVTNTFDSNWNTGIQRVVRRIAESSPAVANELGIECIPVVVRKDRIFAVPEFARPDGFVSTVLRGFRAVRDAPVTVSTRVLQRIAPSLAQLPSRIAKRLRKLFYPRTLAKFAWQSFMTAIGRRIQLKDADTILLTDACWNWDTRPLLQKAESHAIPVVVLVHDLIPVSHPQFFEEPVRQRFVNWLDLMLESASHFCTTSQVVKNELNRYANLLRSSDEQDTGSTIKANVDQTSICPLGADVMQRVRHGEPRSEIRDWLAQSHSTFLTVGTLEPRKNHSYLLDAFDRYWQEGGESSLAIVGRIGWICEDLRDRLATHPEKNKKLLWIENASDAELCYLYDHARATIFPSVVEGFGLPIIESLFYGAPVLASDTAIHREVAGENAKYFDLNDPSTLAKLVHQTDTIDLSKDRVAYQVRDWSTCCHSLLAASLQAVPVANDVRSDGNQLEQQKHTKKQRAA